MSGVRYGAALLARIAALCEADPAREACGYVVRRRGALEVEPIPNVADRHRAEDPLRFPLGSRHAYAMDPRAQLRLLRALEAEGGEVVAVWHSHVEADARLSARDREGALVDGAPLLPGVEYLVLAVRGGRVAEVRRYRHEAGDLVEADLA